MRDWPWWFSLPGTVALVIMAAQIIVLPIGILAGIGDLSGVLSAVSASSGLIGTSLAIALVAVICGIPLAAALAVSLPDRSRARTLFWIAVTLPLAIPSPLIGMGLVAVWNPVLPAGADGSILLPVIAALARFLPIAILIMSAQIRLVDPSLLDAARFIPTPARAIRIVLPLLAPGLALAAVALFSLTLGELGATILVIPPGLETLTMKTYNYLHYGSFSAVAGLCALMAGLTIFVTGACLFLAGFWVRRFRLAGGLHHD